jgi:hypothetical protein
MAHQVLPAVLAVALALAGGVNTSAEPPRKSIGLLTCTLNDRGGDGTARDISCAFVPSTAPGQEQKYVGAVRGLPADAQGKQVLMWTVMAPAGMEPTAGFLEQRYLKEKTAGHPPHWAGEARTEISLEFQTHGSAELGSAIADVVLRAGATRA